MAAKKASKSLVIVESPAKARTIAKFLPPSFVVESSVGHIRDLPESASEIPARHKSEAWARLGVNVDHDFEPLYVVSSDKKKQVQKLKSLLAECDRLYLATDEDREGESISWHLFEVLEPEVPTHRLVFHEITRRAITESLESPREIDLRLVRAQETRRILDRLYGYEVSPLLWKKVAPRLSAGRVQSVALAIVVERERQRMRFRSAEFWDLGGEFRTRTGETFESLAIMIGDARIATGKDFDPSTGTLESSSSVIHLDRAKANELARSLARAAFKVTSVERKPFVQKPPAPFTTSTLQQEGARKLRFSAKHTMSVAQRLYENGYITYMRTDSTTLSDQAIGAARGVIAELYGDENLPPSPRIYKTTVKNAQEAHEAIRPAGDTWRALAEIRKELHGDEFSLYELIWKRTVACQMRDATGQRVVVRLAGGNVTFQATGRVVEFPGFLRAYVEGSDNPEGELAERDRNLPALKEGEALEVVSVQPREHHTEPPARLTEAALIKELEANGIGRPSTWASVIETILDRHYVAKVNGALVPSFTAFAVTKLLGDHFPALVDLGFTARMEDDLDAISRGEAESLPYLRSFYFGNGRPGLKMLLAEKSAAIEPREVCTIPLGRDDQERDIAVRVGRYGPYLQRGDQTAPIPEGTLPDALTIARANEILDGAAAGPRILGVDPATGRQISLRTGRFGPYVQLEAPEGEKGKNASLLAGMTPDAITLEQALALLTLPRHLGQDANGVDVTAHNGRFGPYIKRGSDSRSLQAQDNLLTIALPRALELLAMERTGRGRGRGAGALRVLGKAAPLDGAEVKLMDGRYGAYVTDGDTNATVPKGVDVAALTLDEAVALILARREMGGSKKKRRAKTRGRSAPAPRAAKTTKTAKPAKATKRAASASASAPATPPDGDAPPPAKKAASKKAAAPKPPTKKVPTKPAKKPASPSKPTS